MAETVADTRRLITKPQNLNDAYGPPSNFLEIDVSNPQTVGVGRGRFTTYEVRVKVRDLSEAACLGGLEREEETGLGFFVGGGELTSGFSSLGYRFGFARGVVGPVILPPPCTVNSTRLSWGIFPLKGLPYSLSHFPVLLPPHKKGG